MTPEIAAPVAVVPYWTHLVPVLIAGIGAIQVIGLAIVAAKFGGAKKEIVTELQAVKTSAADTATSIEKVHVAVNSERTAMTDEIKKLRNEILELSKDKAKSDQRAETRAETKSAEATTVSMTVEKMDVAELNVPDKKKEGL